MVPVCASFLTGLWIWLCLGFQTYISDSFSTNTMWRKSGIIQEFCFFIQTRHFDLTVSYGMYALFLFLVILLRIWTKSLVHPGNLILWHTTATVKIRSQGYENPPLVTGETSPRIDQDICFFEPRLLIGKCRFSSEPGNVRALENVALYKKEIEKPEWQPHPKTTEDMELTQTYTGGVYASLCRGEIPKVRLPTRAWLTHVTTWRQPITSEVASLLSGDKENQLQFSDCISDMRWACVMEYYRK